jgi:hypothetical protein
MHPDTGAAVYMTGVLPAELDHAHLAIPRISEIGSSLRVRRCRSDRSGFAPATAKAREAVEITNRTRLGSRRFAGERPPHPKEKQTYELQ